MYAHLQQKPDQETELLEEVLGADYIEDEDDEGEELFGDDMEKYDI